MTVSPVTSALVPRVGEGFWAGQGINDLAEHFNRATAFHREIFHNELEGNPRDFGGNEMRLSKDYHKKSFGME
jgi:hypothetical protein